MKLAEALIERADLQKYISQLESRMKTNIKVQEGDEPAEKIDELLSEHTAAMSRLEGLIVAINKTNNSVLLDNRTLAQLIAQRDCIKSTVRLYRELYSEASISHDRYRGSEIKFVRCIDIAELQRNIDAKSREYRELDTRIQGANWTVDLVR